MKVACVVPQMPREDRSGLEIRLRGLIGYLVEQGLVPVIMVEADGTLEWQPCGPDILPVPRSRSVRERGLWVQTQVRRYGCDVLYVHGWRAGLDIAGRVAVPTFVDICDSLALAAVRYWRRRPSPRRFVSVVASVAREASLLFRSNGVSYISEKDARIVPRTPGQAIRVIVPNGVSLPLKPVTLRVAVGSAPNVLFLGALGYRPNIEGVQWFVNRVWPLVRSQFKDATFMVVGRDPQEEVLALGRIPGVQIVGSVPSIAPWIGLADVMVVPLLTGAGVKNKTLLGLAYGVPVVTTPVGAEGTGTKNGRELLVARSPEQMAESVIRILRDRSLAARLAQNGHRYATKNFTWTRAGQALVGGLEAVIQRERRRS